jgi:hypothetical protein
VVGLACAAATDNNNVIAANVPARAKVIIVPFCNTGRVEWR